MSYTLQDFDYELPPDLIAQAPARERSASRLLHVADRRMEDFHCADLPRFVGPDDLLVFNDTRVIRARVTGRKPTGGHVEMLIERIIGADEAWVQMKASHLPQPGTAVLLANGAKAIVRERAERWFRVNFEGTGALDAWLDAHGALPLPPYIARAADITDSARYQTIYARVPGAVAAPTAGLHFDTALLAALARRGAASAFVTLHVGAGTFQPVTSDDLTQHRMHAERFHIPGETAAAIAACRVRGGRILAVGTTSLRALESAADATGAVRSGDGETTLFITPGFRFRVVDRLLTNFHLPRSTLLMLVAAFAGPAEIRAAYAHAIAARYRFFSYGDAMLLERANVAG